jgi:hypothetical protein
MENALVELCVLPGGALVLTPVLFLFLLLVWPGFDWDRQTLPKVRSDCVRSVR